MVPHCARRAAAAGAARGMRNHAGRGEDSQPAGHSIGRGAGGLPAPRPFLHRRCGQCLHRRRRDDPLPDDLRRSTAPIRVHRGRGRHGHRRGHLTHTWPGASPPVGSSAASWGSSAWCPSSSPPVSDFRARRGLFRADGLELGHRNARGGRLRDAGEPALQPGAGQASLRPDWGGRDGRPCPRPRPHPDPDPHHRYRRDDPGRRSRPRNRPARPSHAHPALPGAAARRSNRALVQGQWRPPALGWSVPTSPPSSPS